MMQVTVDGQRWQILILAAPGIGTVGVVAFFIAVCGVHIQIQYLEHTMLIRVVIINTRVNKNIYRI